MAWPVAELQADPEFQALPPAVQERVMSKLIPAGAAEYKGAPDEPLENTDFGGLSNEGVGNIARYGVPAAAAFAGPAGLAAGMGVAGLAGAGGSALGDVAEEKPISGSKAAASGALNSLGVPVSRVLGAAAGVGAAKTGLKKIGGEMDLTNVAETAKDVSQNYATGDAPGVAKKILEILGRAGKGPQGGPVYSSNLPINAPGAKPSVEMIRKQIPWREEGGKQLTKTLRDEAATQRPDYDKLLQQFRSMHSLTDIPTWREILPALMLGGGGYSQMGWPGLAALLLPRIGHAASRAPKAPGIQAGMSGLTNALTQSME